MVNIMMLVSVCFVLTAQLCQGFVVLDPETKSLDQYGYKIVSINGESVGESQPFKEVTSEKEYSTDDVDISSLLPALKKGLKKVGVNEDGSHFAIGELLDEIFDFEGSGEEENDNQDSEKPVNVTLQYALMYQDSPPSTPEDDEKEDS